MEAVNSVYKEVKKMFQTAVPPYVATVNDDYHYEVWAIKKQAGGTVRFISESGEGFQIYINLPYGN